MELNYQTLIFIAFILAVLILATIVDRASLRWVASSRLRYLAQARSTMLTLQNSFCPSLSSVNVSAADIFFNRIASEARRSLFLYADDVRDDWINDLPDQSKEISSQQKAILTVQAFYNQLNRDSNVTQGTKGVEYFDPNEFAFMSYKCTPHVYSSWRHYEC